MTEHTKRRPGRPRTGTGTKHFDLTLPVNVMNAFDALLHMMGLTRSSQIAKVIADSITEKAETEELNEATAYALLGRFQDIVIRSIEPISLDSLTEEEWTQIRGTGALVGNAEVYGAWLVIWTPVQYANAPYPWQVMVVKSISPLTGEPAFMTVPARGKVPTYFEQ